MTREEEAIKALCNVTGTYEEVVNSPIVNDLLFPVHEIVAAMLEYGQQRADAEAAAMRERAAKLCDERGAEEQKGFGLTRAAQNYFRARDAIRALPATGEVGHG